MWRGALFADIFFWSSFMHVCMCIYWYMYIYTYIYIYIYIYLYVYIYEYIHMHIYMNELQKKVSANSAPRHIFNHNSPALEGKSSCSMKESKSNMNECFICANCNVHCNTLEHTATSCSPTHNTPQHPTTHCTILQHTLQHNTWAHGSSWRHAAAEHRSTLHLIASHCNILQYIKTPEHMAVHDSVQVPRCISAPACVYLLRMHWYTYWHTHAQPHSITH